MPEDVVGGTGEDHCFFERAGVSGLVFEWEGADCAGCVWSHGGVLTYFPGELNGILMLDKNFVVEFSG